MKFFTFLFLITLFSCSGVRKAKKIKNHIVKDSHAIKLGGEIDSLKITYIGCGGYLIQDEASAIMLDPYFSNLSPMLFLPFKKLKTDTSLIDEFFIKNFDNKKDINGKLKAILIAHSHYDHMADVPSLVKRNSNEDSLQVIGSRTTHHMLQGANVDSKYFIYDPTKVSKNPSNEINQNDFFYLNNGRIRILPIVSNHAPHLFGMKFLSSKKVKKDFSKFPNKISKMPEGENFNYLIDYLDQDGKIKFRIFSNAGSSCDFPIGFPPNELLKERPVDILLLCVASFKQVENYPLGLIEYIQPRHIILNHWENFFKPIKKLQAKPATVSGTNVRKFISLLEKSKWSKGNYTMPLPLVDIMIYK